MGRGRGLAAWLWVGALLGATSWFLPAAAAGLDPRPVQGPRAVLHVGDRLTPGEVLVSDDNRHRLVLQTDGNLVLYAWDGMPTQRQLVLFSTDTVGQSMRELIMQADGNLVLYRTDGSVAWQSGTPGRAVDFAVLQNDGNFVIYKDPSAVFSLGTGVHRSMASTVSDRRDAGPDRDRARLSYGTYLRSPSGTYTLVVDVTPPTGCDCDLAWIYSAAGARPTLVAGGPKLSAIEVTTDALRFGDGPGVLYQREAGAAPLAALILGDDGVLRLLDAELRVVWFIDARCGSGVACVPPS